MHRVLPVGMKRILLILPLLMLSTGCYFQKNKDDTYWKPEVVAKIEVGTTTKAQVLELLGPPRKIIKLHDTEAFVFEHVIEKRTGLFVLILTTHRVDKQRDAVTVIIDRKGVVTAVGSRFNADDASFGSPWGD